jgi:hypothetical protein
MEKTMTTGAFTRLHRGIKTSETNTHVFFLNGPFSQWHPGRFEQRLHPTGPLLAFNCAEQHMMAGKAHAMGDEEALERVMAVEQDPRDWRRAPKRHKELGRTVRGRAGGAWTPEDVAYWNSVADDVVFRGNWAKFDQDADALSFLRGGPDDDLAFSSKTLVEGAHYDREWGVGLAWDDPAIVDPANWRGANRLGRALMLVRDHRRELRVARRSHPSARFDAWTRTIVLDERDHAKPA